MPVVAPVLNYVLHDDFTPAQRAQLTRSHKKVEQLLGVTPSLRPLPNTPHCRSKSLATTPTRTKSRARERGGLRGLFGIEITTTTSRVVEDECEAILHRVSTDSSTSSSDSSDSSSSTTSLPEYGSKASRTRKRRPPPLKIACSNFGSDEEQVVDIRPVHEVSPKQSLTDLDASPITPLFNPRDTSRQRSRASIIAEQEWDRVVKGSSILFCSMDAST